MNARSLRSVLGGAVLLAAALSVSAPAFAQDHDGHDHSGHDHAAHGHEAPVAEGASAASTHAGDEAEGHEAHGHAPPSLDEYNLYYGFLGERDDVEPSVLWRPKGTPVPFGALLLNSGILFFLLYRFGKKPVSDALKARKANLLKGMEEAAQMKKEAEARLADYEQKLATVDQEIERVRSEMRASGESERKRILAEAKEKRTRMERDAQVLITQELKAARENLLADMSRAALKSAETALKTKITAADQSRLAEEYLAGIKGAASALRGKV
jgi:F-type H+-transporting ATPase subunit b